MLKKKIAFLDLINCSVLQRSACLSSTYTTYIQ
ncbi:hypothetical protein MHA_0787 [Mannheimia haemolytica PHL213]|nr:hypothetical protein MHA_0787 [Mannheimia haemolytica PHL213]